MGLSDSIEIKFTEKYDFEQVVEKLLNHGWSLNDCGEISYVDNDSFDWKTSGLHQQEATINKLNRHFINGKTVVLNFLFNETNGGNFIFLDEVTICVNLNINRVRIETTNHTDFSFYILRLSSILKNYNFDCIESV